MVYAFEKSESGRHPKPQTTEEREESADNKKIKTTTREDTEEVL